MEKSHSLSKMPPALPVLLSIMAAAIAIPGVAATAAAAAEVGDFAPLTKGNTWTYSGTERMFCKALSDEISVIRSITVDSMGKSAAVFTCYLSYRDSVHWTSYGRWGMVGQARPADVVRKGRFVVRQKPGTPDLYVTPFSSDSLPSEMDMFFRRHTFPADRITPDTGAMASRGEVRYSSYIPKTVWNKAAFVKDVGMTRLEHTYNVFNTNNVTAPARIVTYDLIAFNGKPRTARGPSPLFESDLPVEPLSPKDFAPVALGGKWVYQGIRRVDSAGTVSRDSICRSLTVKSGSGGGFVLTLKDSLYARLRADKPKDAEIKSVDFSVSGGEALPNGNTGIGIWEHDSDPSWSDPLRFFNGKRYPARDVEERVFPDGPRSVVAYAEGSPGILVDTTVYAEGVGLVRRAKTMNDGRAYIEEFRLIEFQGKAFQAVPVSLAAPAASASPRAMSRARDARFPVPTWRGRDAAGKRWLDK